VNVAIFGGTFDPVHNAHVEVARAARKEYFLDRILFVLASEPPHKTGRFVADYEHRYEMVRIACQEHPAFEPSRLEAPGRDRGRNYSIQTIRRVADRLTTHDRLFFLIGADAFSEIATWYHWRTLIREIEFIVVNRPGYVVDEAAVPPGVRVHLLRSVNNPISSSEIRRRLASSQSVRGLMPPLVARYITKNKLYRPARRPARKRAAKAHRR